MAPHQSAETDAESRVKSMNGISDSSPTQFPSNVLHSSRYQELPPQVVSASGSYLTLSDGRRIFEACGGPGVTCIGHGNLEVTDAVHKQMEQFSYCFGLYYSNLAAEELARHVIASTDGAMARAAIMSSGKEEGEIVRRTNNALRLGSGRSSNEARN